jgi:hypothetical protein
MWHAIVWFLLSSILFPTLPFRKGLQRATVTLFCFPDSYWFRQPVLCRTALLRARIVSCCPPTGPHRVPHPTCTPLSSMLVYSSVLKMEVAGFLRRLM